MNRKQRRAGATGRSAASSRTRLSRSPIVDALESFRDGDLAGAEAICRRILARRSGDSDANHILGLIAHHGGDLAGARESIGKAVAAAPDNQAFHYNLGNVLRDSGDTEGAVEAYRRALDLDPALAEAAGNLAALLEDANRLEEAKTTAAVGLAANPGDPLLNLTMAKLERRRGDPGRALDRLAKVERASLDPVLGMGIDFELGRNHDLAGDAQRAYAHFAEANSVHAGLAAANGFDKECYLAEIDASSRRFTEDWVASWTPTPPPPPGDAGPAFVVGFPRSGTTLLEQLIDAHPGTRTLSEKPAVEAMKRAVAALPKGYPRALAGLDRERIDGLRAAYHEAAGRFVEGHPERLLVDKLPLNMAEAGLIARVFPDARFVLAVRHPCDVCLSCFMQSFTVNDAMASFFTVEDAARLYVRVMELWQRYQRVLGLDVHTVRYEDLIDDFRGESERLLEFLGLEWDDAVLAFAESAKGRGRIATPSYHQVSEPLYRRARYRWRRYAELLRPVMAELKPFIEGFGYSAD